MSLPLPKKFCNDGDAHVRDLANTTANLEELRHQIQIAWDTIPQDQINNLLSSMLRRVEGCHRLQGNHTHY